MPAPAGRAQSRDMPHFNEVADCTGQKSGKGVVKGTGKGPAKGIPDMVDKAHVRRVAGKIEDCQAAKDQMRL